MTGRHPSFGSVARAAHFLAVDTPDGTGFDDLLGHSITYRVALGPHQGRKAFTLQTVPAAPDTSDGKLARAAGFSLHAGVACEAHEREELARLCRYITRPAVSTERLSSTAQGNIRYRLVAPAHPAHATFVHPCTAKTPYRDGTTDVVLEPLDFIARPAALVPTPRVNLTRYHGVFAPNHRLREQVTPARRGRRGAETANEPAPARHVSMTWAQRLKRVFQIEIETCNYCGGAVKVAAPAHPARAAFVHPCTASRAPKIRSRSRRSWNTSAGGLSSRPRPSDRLLGRPRHSPCRA